ncbi:MAG: hypothetical protein HZB66_01855 [Candidatus Aenigmarchaeota archaeon]|nr:hypothetical protein [Candidatus Aenigmarchaeota archaeon]
MSLSKQLSEKAKELYAIIIIAVVVFGAVSYFIKDINLASVSTLLVIIIMILWVHNDDIDKIKKELDINGNENKRSKGYKRRK